jgi:hypothetical protein
MSKLTKQPSGVVAGTLDVSRQTSVGTSAPTDAGAVLDHRRQMRHRVASLEEHRPERREPPTPYRPPH